MRKYLDGKLNGKVYTPRNVVDKILDDIGYGAGIYLARLY